MAIGKGGTSTNSTSENSSPGKHSFQLTPAETKKQANLLVFGEAGTGKTSFATMYAPEPVALISLDGRGEDAVADARLIGRTIIPSYIDPITKSDSAEIVRTQARSIIEEVYNNVQWAVAESLAGRVRTICLDTGTEYSEIAKLAFDGERGQTKDGAFGKDKDYVNFEWWRLFKLIYTGKAHFIITAREKEIWIADNSPGAKPGARKATGRFTYRGPTVMNDGVKLSGQIRLKKTSSGRQLKEAEFEVTKAGVNRNELSEVYTEKDWGEYGPFVWACYNQFINTSNISDWE